MTIKNPKSKEEWEVSGIGTGEYNVKATSNSGIVRYAVVYVDNISDKLKAPVISINPSEPNGKNEWYISNVGVTMNTDSASSKEIRYKIIENGLEVSPEEGIKYEGNFNISANGVIEIKAWTTDGKYISDPEKASITIQMDLKKPSLEYPPKIISSKTPVNNWYKSDLEIEVNGEDEHSKIAGYRYKIEGESGNWIDRKINQKISIGANEREGITKIAIKTFDYAGNESESKTLTIQKDTGNPDTAKLEFKSNTANSITVNAYGNDNVSGISSYTFEYKKEASTTWEKLANAEVKSETGKVEYTYAGIERGEYILRVTVKDKAGNETPSTILPATTVLNTPPKFTENTYSAGTTTMTIYVTATDDEQTNLTYNLYWNGSSNITQTQTKLKEEQVTFSVTTEMYTEYSWIITVNDGSGGTATSNGNGKTKCSGKRLNCERRNSNKLYRMLSVAGFREDMKIQSGYINFQEHGNTRRDSEVQDCLVFSVELGVEPRIVMSTLYILGHKDGETSKYFWGPAHYTCGDGSKGVCSIELRKPDFMSFKNDLISKNAPQEYQEAFDKLACSQCQGTLEVKIECKHGFKSEHQYCGHKKPDGTFYTELHD